MSIRLLPFVDEFQIFPNETTETVRQRLMLRFQVNFQLSLIETSNNRELPPDEILLDGREYYAVLTYDLPIRRISA